MKIRESLQCYHYQVHFLAIHGKLQVGYAMKCKRSDFSDKTQKTEPSLSTRHCCNLSYQRFGLMVLFESCLEANHIRLESVRKNRNIPSRQLYVWDTYECGHKIVIKRAIILFSIIFRIISSMGRVKNKEEKRRDNFELRNRPGVWKIKINSKSWKVRQTLDKIIT